LPTRHRRAFAATAAVLWLLGVEVLPNLHLATHHHDHTHTADGSIVLLDRHEHEYEHEHDHEHEHGDAEHRHADDDDLAALGVAHEHVDIAFVDYYESFDQVEHDAVGDEPPASDTRQHGRRVREQLAIDHDIPPGHAALGIAHHAMALHQPPPPLLAPVATPNVETWKHATPNERLTSAERGRPNARGPPVA
jgi:hypothetical protein